VVTTLDLNALATATRVAWTTLKRSAHDTRNATLAGIADGLLARREAIVAANADDLAAGAEAGLDAAMLDRLRLDAPRIAALAADVRTLIDLPDPLAVRFDERVLPNGLRLHRRRVPIGVLGVIYESRPNVSIDVAALAIKSGNAAILRGGKESLRTNLALIEVVRAALRQSGLPANAIDLVRSTDRAHVLELLKLDAFVDLIIPRGGAALHAFCREHARMPVITGGIGICHLYIDDRADLARVVAVIRNAKVQRPTVCNALDTVLVHRAVAARVLPELVRTLAQDGVTFRADAEARALLAGTIDDDATRDRVQAAGPDDFDTEWLSLVLGIRVVDDLDAAITHIDVHSSGHSDGILTEDAERARDFLERVDSAAVYWNASTRFTDGGQFGLGAEVAVSTQRIHARGPMGLEELTSYKWVAEGDYHVRQ
jgi:glutamate-5-semialdehyde dehydrogenase